MVVNDQNFKAGGAFFCALKTKKILSTNHHYGDPSTRFSVEPKMMKGAGRCVLPAPFSIEAGKKLRFPRPLAVFPNVRQKTGSITAGLVSKQAEERCVPHQPFVLA